MLLRHDRLSSDALRELATGKVLALHVPEYHAPDLCTEIVERILDGMGKGYRRIYESNVRAFTETRGDAETRRAYLATAIEVMAEIRRSCHPLASPVDRLRCELDELWPGGACLLRLEENALVFGMVRVWRGGAQAHPHLDVLRESAPDVRDAAGFTEQLGVNIYLRMPAQEHDSEGALELWDFGLMDEAVIGRSSWGTYGYRRETLPNPTIRIRPAVGDLIILRTTRLHAVQPTCDGERITLSGFIGCSGPDEPLRLWS
ncbi:2OG-Fe(II) oxygenase [Nonomuraea soli]|uniref:2OG-Fe(II) oxygenase n=1 Tax=Nonomuraea soli TaxID=1032476 RepID=A0A7W0HU39_9ACTN|nr:2OG-Fe(II) oxygenase [Nonomuraea soli]MBA2895675.1 hypothetical protein [Nonomuraea soli]